MIERVPREDRHAEHRHARSAQREDRGDEVHRAEDGAEALEGEAHHPEVTTDARGERGVRQRRVRRPAERGRTLRCEEACQRDERAEGEEPERERVQSREGDVGCADLKRHQHIREAGEQRCREHQQHHRAVHGEHLVVLLFGLEDLHPRLPQLQTDEQSHHAAEAEEEEGADQIHVSDRLVVSGGDPADEDTTLAGRYRIGGRTDDAGRTRVSRSHQFSAPSCS